MSALSRLLDMARQALDSQLGGEGGGRPVSPTSAPAAPASSAPVRRTSARTPTGSTDAADRAAIARYDYLLQTADPHQIEQVHREAFARLTPEQRAQIENRMRAELPEHERPRTADADDLARAAARTEAARPGVLRGLLARASGGRGRGVLGGAAAGAGLAAGGMLAAVAGGAVVSTVAGPLLEQAAGLGVDFDAFAGAVDLEAMTGGVEGLAAGAGDQLTGLGDQVREFGSGFTLPGLDDLFNR